MTDDEKRRQKGDLLLEINEAEQHLKHLEEKAKRIAGLLDSVARWLTRTVEARQSNEMQRIPVAFQDKKYAPDDPNIEIAMRHDALLELRQELLSTRQKLENLKEQKQYFGLM